MDEATLIKRLNDEGTRQEAFTQLVKQYQEPLYNQIRRMVLIHEDADDVLQNTFIKAWTGLENFRGDSKLSTWLYRIAVNESLNFLERQKKKTTSIDTDEPSLGMEIANTLQSDPYFDGDEVEMQLQQAIALLPEKQRAVFNMKYFQEMKYEEMSAIMGITVGALKANYHHAVKKISDFFKLND